MLAVYKRYFKVTSGELVDEFKRLIDVRNKAIKIIRKLNKEIGSIDININNNGHIVGFEFEKKPDSKLWKKVHFGYYPKQNTQWGRELVKRIKALPHFPSLQDALSAVGLSAKGPCLIGEGTGYYSTLMGSLKHNVFFVVVPWCDVEQKELNDYKYMRDGKIEGRTGWSRNYEHLLWTPPDDWAEVKEWEMLKAKDEIFGGNDD